MAPPPTDDPPEVPDPEATRSGVRDEALRRIVAEDRELLRRLARWSTGRQAPLVDLSRGT
jgi:hypothetical protein